ncbi:MAG: hypothetical protein ACI85K_002175 [Hyphomicrobiaceae bacterium]
MAPDASRSSDNSIAVGESSAQTLRVTTERDHCGSLKQTAPVANDRADSQPASDTPPHQAQRDLPLQQRANPHRDTERRRALMQIVVPDRKQGRGFGSR